LSGAPAAKTKAHARAPQFNSQGFVAGQIDK
jgi:hypothetical protein